MALTLGERHRVGQPHAPGLGGECRLDHQRSRQVAPLAAIRARRLDLPVPALGVEDLGEHRRAVVARKAQPADRPVAVDQRRRVAVGQQAVVGDRPKALVCCRSPCVSGPGGSSLICGSNLEVRAWAFVRRAPESVTGTALDCDVPGTASDPRAKGPLTTAISKSVRDAGSGGDEAAYTGAQAGAPAPRRARRSADRSTPRAESPWSPRLPAPARPASSANGTRTPARAGRSRGSRSTPPTTTRSGSGMASSRRCRRPRRRSAARRKQRFTRRERRSPTRFSRSSSTTWPS